LPRWHKAATTDPYKKWVGPSSNAREIRMNRYRIAAIPGDGIGKEVVAEGLRALTRAGEVTGSFEIDVATYPWSCAWYVATGQMMPQDGIAQLGQHDAIYLGAIGFPGVPDHISIWGLLLPIRQEFDQYVNLRPVEVLDGIDSPLRGRGSHDVNILCVRENTEGEYVGVGGRFKRGQSDEVAVQTSIFTRRGIRRIARFAFERAQERRKRLASATKSNALQYTAVLWDEVVSELAADYPNVAVSNYHVDALAARFVVAPDSLDVVVASNLFGDILTDLGGALQGSLGLPASGNLNPERKHPSMFEPVHGSAPDLAGKGVANPMAAIWAAALMLQHLGQSESAGLILKAMRDVAKTGPKTADVGGSASTHEVGSAIVSRIGEVP
jgi:tartrate dehydrogenase/decarboxylase/D-malate dehydrogenase